MVLHVLHNNTNVVQFDYLYMESGHSQMECDSVHACKHFRYLKREPDRIFFKHDAVSNSASCRTLNISQGHR